MAYDGSAKEKGESYSFNDHLKTGPNCYSMHVLIRFRSRPIELTSDIRRHS